MAFGRVASRCVFLVTPGDTWDLLMSAGAPFCLTMDDAAFIRRGPLGAGRSSVTAQRRWQECRATSCASLGAVSRIYRRGSLRAIRDRGPWCGRYSMDQIPDRLDVDLREDASRIQADHGRENIALPRKIALELANSECPHHEVRSPCLQNWTLLTRSGFALYGPDSVLVGRGPPSKKRGYRSKGRGHRPERLSHRSEGRGYRAMRRVH
jgi:hypothetical protein